MSLYETINYGESGGLHHTSFTEYMFEVEGDDTLDSLFSLDAELYINTLLPGLSSDEPTAILIDANNLYRRAKEVGYRIDYGKLNSIFSNRCNLQYRGIFTAVDRDYSAAGDWVSYMIGKGYTVVDKDLKKHINKDGLLVTKGNMDVEMTIAALTLSDSFEHIILGTCDVDFVPLIDRLRFGKQKKVSVLGMHGLYNVGMPRDLILAADNFYDMNELAEFMSYKRGDP